MSGGTNADICILLSIHTRTHAHAQDYYRSGRMLVRMAQAIGRLVLAGRELTRLAGYVQLCVRDVLECVCVYIYVLYMCVCCVCTGIPRGCRNCQ